MPRWTFYITRSAVGPKRMASLIGKKAVAVPAHGEHVNQARHAIVAQRLAIQILRLVIMQVRVMPTDLRWRSSFATM